MSDPIVKESLSLKLAARMRARISAGDWVPGTRLPAERELSDEFSVSRSVVREANTILAAQGLIRTRQGGGAFVCQTLGETVFDAVAFVLPAGDRTLQDLMAVRKALEPAAAALAAAAGTEEELAAIEREAQAIETARSLDEQIAAGIRFHLAVTRASGNGLMIRIITSLLDLVVASHRITLDTVKGHLEGVIDHEAIGRAIWARDPEAAHEAMREHLCHTEDLLALSKAAKPRRAACHLVRKERRA
ncbi:MAG: FadR family transcriptional regulator [Betaproteobacteria bacterium]|nr:FadR family transcriptional regulator [Betaproteobacteria bacterium]